MNESKSRPAKKRAQPRAGANKQATTEPATVTGLDDELKTMIRDAQARLNSAIEEFNTRANEVKKVVEKSVGEGISETESVIKANPFAAVGIAAGIGMLLGLLINRNR